jgi:hypothetical protein
MWLTVDWRGTGQIPLSTVTRVWRKRLVRTRLDTKVRTSSILRRILIGARVQRWVKVRGGTFMREGKRGIGREKTTTYKRQYTKTICPPPSSVIFAEKSSGKFFPASALCHDS